MVKYNAAQDLPDHIWVCALLQYKYITACFGNRRLQSNLLSLPSVNILSAIDGASLAKSHFVTIGITDI